MDVTLLVALASIVLLLILAIAFFFKKSETPKQDERPRAAPRVREGLPRRAQMARNRGARLRANAPPQEHPPSDDENNRNDREQQVEVPDGAKLGAKKKAKLEAKAEKKAQREAEEQQRAERRKKDQLAEEERKKSEAKLEAEEKRRDEEEKRAKEEKEKREYDEYLKMKEAFSVEEEGYEEGEEDSQNLLQEFVKYIKNNKVVVIEDLAAQFKLKTQAAIDRIKDLQQDDILTGVIDDRGKFIYVSPEEMNIVAKFIRQRGRVSISELAENSNKLINLTPVTAGTN